MTTETKVRVETERVRELLGAATAGPWTVFDDAEPLVFIEAPDPEDPRAHLIVAELAGGPANAALIATAPDLAADLLDAREECAAQRETLDALLDSARRSDDECRRARSALDQTKGELARLRAVVAGRDVAPTDAELDAHRAAGGGWLLAWYGAAGMATEVVFDRRTAAEALEEAASLDGLFLALPLGSDRRPTAWPVPATGGTPR
mgnify:CR=1 FL=1